MYLLSTYQFHCVIVPNGLNWHGTTCEEDYGDKLQWTRQISTTTGNFVVSILSDIVLYFTSSREFDIQNIMGKNGKSFLTILILIHDLN